MPKSKASSNTTTDHDEIREWAEERGAKPACVRGTGGKGDIGMIRLEFPGKPGANDDKLEPISWDEFFEKFDENGLALVMQEQTADGEKSNFNKLVSRETVEEKQPKNSSGRSSAAKKSTGRSSAAKKSSGRSSSSTAKKATKRAPAKAGAKATAKARTKSARR